MKKFLLSSIVFLSLTLVIRADGQRLRSYLFSYDVIINNIPRDAAEINVWVPYPVESLYQSVEEISQKNPRHRTVTYDKKFRNKILHYSIKHPDSSTIEINHLYKITRREYSIKTNSTSRTIRISSDKELKKYLEPSRLVTISPKIQKLAAQITGDKTGSLEKAKAIYDYVFENVEYNKTVPGWGQGDTERVCDLKTGNCTDFHSLFISLSRASNIPAKFVIGFPIPKKNRGEVSSYHCWAEFYTKKSGWIPVDISEAWKDQVMKEYYFRAIDENRIEFTHGRDIVLEPCYRGEPFNYFIYPHVEIDNNVKADVQVAFKFQDITNEGRVH